MLPPFAPDQVPGSGRQSRLVHLQVFGLFTQSNRDLLPVTPRTKEPAAQYFFIRLVLIIIVPCDVLEPCRPLEVFEARGE